jgi:parallel beta-helix repeat protein
VQSIAIDAGNPADAFANEPLDNGNIINAGAYGNTVQASRSPATFLTVKGPDGGEIWVANQTFNIRWTAHNLNAPGVTYAIDLLRAGVPVLNIAANAAGTGSFLWTVPVGLTPANDYTVRVTANGAGGLSDVSNAPFSIAEQVTVYYVNDNTVDAGDWTNAPGNDLNDGLSPVTPKASIQSLLATYDFGPGDRIRVDSGTYVLGSDIVITANDAGVTIEGFHDSANPARKTVLNRNAPSRPAFELQNADGVTLDRLEITGASIGVLASATSDSDDVVIRNSRFITNATGVSIDTNNDRATIQNSFFDGGSTFMQRHMVLNGSDGLIEQNQFTRGGTGGNSGSGTVMASGARTLIQNNEIFNDRSVSGSIFVNSATTVEADRIIVRNNVIRDMTTTAIFAGNGTLVESNTIRNTTIPSFGNVFAINSSGLVRNNVIHTSDYGLTGPGTFENNRLYNNRRAIQASTNGRYVGNRIYDNAEAISAISVSNVLIANNELYRNDLGVTLNGSVVRLENNTILQTSGHAINFATGASGGIFINNIFQVDNGNVYHAPQSATITSSDYNHYCLTGTGNVANFAGQVYADPIAWYHTTGFDKNSFHGDPLFIDVDGADNQLGFDRINLIDYGADDSFIVQPLSTTIDAGWPLSAYSREPAPHGTRINIGSTGNTASAASRLDPQLYVIDPNGLEKIPVGSNTTIRWQSSGLTQSIPVMLVNLGSTSIVDNFLADSVRLEGTVSGNGAIDTSGVASPAPAAIYTSAVSTTGGVGTKAAFQLPVPDGDYTLRLHFAAIFGIAGRTLDVVVNGVTLATDFDPFVAAGGVNRAAVLPLNVFATGGTGIRLEIVAKNAFGARIHGLEVLTNNAVGLTDPRVDVQWSSDGTNWNNIATDQPMDRFGRGQVNWSVPSNLPLGNGYRIRTISSSGTPVASDLSDKTFEIVGGGSVFYINDGSSAGDTFTMSLGNDANSGKSPAFPMASLESLLRNYDLNPGDVIYVDSGIYNLANDLVIGNSDSGVQIVGPADRSAIFDRGSVASGSRAFVLDNADNITFENVEIRNSGNGIFANFAQGANAGSDGLTIRNSRFTNSQAGLSIDAGNNGVSVIDSIFDGGTGRNMGYHMLLGGTNSLVSGNLFTRSSGANNAVPSVQVVGASSLVDNNQFIDNRGTNLLVSGGTSAANGTRAINNVVRDSLANGIAGNGGFTVVENNQVFNLGGSGNLSQPLAGLTGNGTFRNNIVHSTQLGMQVSGSAVGNTVFNSSLAGMWITGNGNVSANTIYSNPIGAVVRSDNPLLSNNLIYGNATGVRLENSFSSARLINNTIYQVTGDAIVAATSGAIQIENNILSVDTGTAIAVASGNPTITGDFNAFQVRSTGNIASQGGTNYPNLTTWAYLRGTDRNSFVADPLFIDFDGPDNVLGFSGGDFGADDNFRVGTLSPTIDRGNPQSVFAIEPTPNGNRIDIGAYGNTPQASVGSPEQVQLLSPNGLEKLEEGQPVVVRFTSSGLVPERLVGQFSSTATAAGTWAAGQAFRVSGSTTNTSATIDVIGVINPPPQSVYQSHSFSNGVGESLQYAIPVANGTYNIRLHTFEPNTFIGVGGRRFDVQLQGITVDPNVDIRAIAGAANKAIVRTYSGIAVGNGMLDLRMLNLTGNGAVLAAIEITANDAVANPNPTVGLQYSPDLGATWTPVATGIPLDYLGRGQFTWTPSGPTNARSSLLRIVSEQGLGTSDVSDQAFEVVNNGSLYYMSLTGDDANGGKTPDRPMRTIQAILDSFDLDAGDRINVAAGTYLLDSNVIITQQDSGVAIQGPADAGAIFNRQNTNEGSNEIAFDLQNADNITFDSIAVTGAEFGIYAANLADSDNLTVQNSRIFGNQTAGILLGSTNDRLIARNNEVFGLPGGSTLDNQFLGISLRDTNDNSGGNDHLVEGNDIFDNSIGLNLFGLRTIARDNEIHGNATGIRANFSAATLVDGIQILGNEIYANTTQGINSFGVMTIADNEIYGHTSSNFAILAASSDILRNTIRNNLNGLSLNNGLVAGNRFFGNTGTAFSINSNVAVNGNSIYSNSIGLHGLASFAGTITNNLVYANVNAGLFIENSAAGAGTAQVWNNTIYQEVGNAVRLQGSARNIQLSNNIITILSGFGISVDNNSQTGFTSDYNLIQTGNDPNARVGFWNGDRTDLVQWRAASIQDNNSLSADPLFVDIDGADNRFGFSGGIDGGADDNFYRLQNSPATDRGDNWNSPTTDRDGNAALDDPAVANAGRPSLVPSVMGSSLFTLSGTAQPGWRSNNTSFAYSFPGGFTFPFYGTTYSSVHVSTEGFLQFGVNTDAGNGNNSAAELATRPRIAPLWDNLRTNATGDDIYVDTSVAGQIKFVWNATHQANGADVQFAATLFATGQVRFDYGPGNTGLTPTVGIGSGNGQLAVLVPSYDGASSLTNAPSIQWTLAQSFRDLGAYESAGNSGDTTPPQIVSTSPLAVGSQNLVASGFAEILLGFNEPILALTTQSLLLYDLRSSGANDTFGDADDVVVPMTVQYVAMTQQLRLGLTNGSLAAGRYRLSVSGDPAQTLRDLSGNALDGDANGTPGGAFVRTFQVTANNAPVISGTYEFPTVISGTNTNQIGVTVTTILANRVTDPDGPQAGLAVVSVDNTHGVWEYALSGNTFLPIASTLTDGKVLLLGSNVSTRIRFRPNSGFVGLAGIQYRAWDRSDGNAPGTAVLPSQIETRSLSVALMTSQVPVILGNVPPTDIALSSNSIAEDSAIGTQIGLLTTTDPNSADTFVYSLVDGTNSQDNGAFRIVGNTLRSDEEFNFETKSSYSIRIRSTDQGGLFTEKIFTITVIDVNEAPVLTRAQAALSGNVLSTFTNTGTWSDPENQTVTLDASLGTVVRNADGTWSWSFVPSQAYTNQTVTITGTDSLGLASQVQFTLDAIVTVVNSKVYYKGSTFAGASVNAALDTSKVLAKSGSSAQALTFANLINTTRGINGLVFDVAGLAASSLTAADFVFRMSPTGAFNEAANLPKNWVAAPAPNAIHVAAGTSTTPARVRLEWPDNAIANRWLQVQIVANANTGLASPEVYYIGHLYGEVNGLISNGVFSISIGDVTTLRPNVGFSAQVTNPYDLDKNGTVSIGDITGMRPRVGLGSLRAITIPPAGSSDEGEGDGEPGRSLSGAPAIDNPKVRSNDASSSRVEIHARLTNQVFTVPLPFASASGAQATSASGSSLSHEASLAISDAQLLSLDEYFERLGKERALGPRTRRT